MSAGTISRIQQKYKDFYIPWSVHFELSYRCNLRCSHCYVVQDKSDYELNLSEIKRLIKELAQIGVISLTFSGGEIFLRKDILDILNFATKRFYVFLLTNGTLIDEKIAQKLKELGILRVEISLYGRKEIHDEITRTSGSFDKVMGSLRYLNKAGVPVTLKCMAMKENLEEYSYLKEIAEHFGAGFKPGFLIYPKVNASKEPCNLRVPESCFKQLPKWLPSTNMIETETKVYQLSTNNWICNAGRIFCSITPSGDVHPCVMLPWNLGNLRQNSFRSIWQTEVCQELNMLRALGIDDFSECSRCKIFGYCIPCIGLNYLENSDIFKCSAEYCRLACWLHSRQSHPKGGVL
jgi:radical SAM protein with 4Fe4S-binding SPASM domain